MNRRIRNVLLFVASVLGTALLVIGTVAIRDGDESGTRAIIGAAFAFALVVIIILRSRAPERRPDQ
jgi:uncharacterized membrane protein YozB (DUF420 family)